MPQDVVTTKYGQVIMKYRNKKELENAKDKMDESEDIKEMVKINVPIRRRERILILSVDPLVEEATVKKELESQIFESGLEESYIGLTDRLATATMDPGTKALIENLIKGPGRDIRIIRKIQTKQGRNNWLVDVDSNTKTFLLEKRRICIDFERYRVVEFVSITRCFKCQKFGHLANRCDGQLHCTKCAGEHNIKDCKSEKTTCSNCYFEDATSDSNHKADSPSCPIFIAYRESLLPKRS